MYKIILIPIICATLYVQTIESFGLAEMISNYAKVKTNKEENKPTNTTWQGIETYNTTNGNDTLEIVPDYDDFDDIEESNATARVPLMDSGSVLKFINGIVNLVALMSLNRNSESVKPRGSLASDVNSLQDPVKYYPVAQDRFHPDTASKKFKMQAAKLSNSIDQQYQPVDTYPPYNPFSGTNAETYNKDNLKTSYDADDDQYKRNKNQMSSYMSNNVDIQPSYSYELPYQPSKMKKPNNQEASMDMGEDDNGGYQSYKPSKMKYPMQESSMNMADDNGGGYDAYQPHDDSFQMMDTDSMPPKSKYPVYEPWKHHDATDYMPQKSKKPMYIDDNDDDGDDGDDDNADDDMDTPPKKSKYHMHSFDDDESRKPSKNPMPDDNFPVYYSHDHKTPINYHDFHLDHDFHDHPPPPEDHKVEEEDRESKRPYTYFHLGRKLWYVPLFFSVYFIIYIGGLILKSLARHKIQFPEKLWELHDTSHDTHHEDEHHRRNRRINNITRNVVNAIENVRNKYM